MDVPEFALERWFDAVEHDADIMLAESGIRSLPASRFDTDPGELGYVIPTDGNPALRATVAERYDRDAEEVCFTCGAQEANFLLYASLLDADSHAVVVTPTYQALQSLPATFGETTEVALEPPHWDLDVDAVNEAVRPNTELVVLVEPNNPSGRLHDPETVQAVYEIAADADAYLHCDEVYRLLAPDPNPPVASLGPHGVSTSSLTKSHGLAGLRFGWLAGPREVLDGVRRWKDYTTISPGQFGQHVARQLLEHPDREADLLAENRRLAAENHALVAEFLADHGLDWHDPVGVNGFPTVPDGFADGEAFCRTVVEEASVVLAPGEYFGHPERFRLGFGLPTAELREGLARVGDVVDRHAP
jgi:aspartate/methionine/tyrosine aminotransferase